MISLEIIEREISELEAREASYKVCERLAWLYVVRDHLLPPDVSRTQSLHGSEFLDAANGKPYEGVMRVVDEHLETIKLLYPKTFSAILDKIREL
jgi:hypothetical protein